MSEKLIIIGDGETAEMTYEYFTHDSDYEVVAFAVEKDYLEKNKLFGLPVFPFEDLENIYDPEKFNAIVAVSYIQLNRVRTRLFQAVKKKGFKLASYVSSRAFVWHNVKIGDNCFICENTVLQYHAELGDNIILAPGTVVAHRTKIGSNCFVGAQAAISGYCEIGENSFLGVNSTLADFLKVGKDCIIGAGSNVVKDTEDGKVYVGNPAKPMKKSSYDVFGVKYEEI